MNELGDELTMKLHTKFMKDIVARIIAKTIYKKYGYKIDIQLDNLDIASTGGEMKINTNVSIKVDSKLFKEIMSKMI